MRAGLALAITFALVAPSTVSAQSVPKDPCLACDLMYATDCNRGLWTIDLLTGVSTQIGMLPEVCFDLAATSDGRLVAVASDGFLYEISACDASAHVIGSFGGNALGSDLGSTDLFGIGPPLVRMDSLGTGATTVVGGQIGANVPDWCGTSAGDVVMKPADGMLRTALVCSCLNGGTSIQRIDPATGEARGSGFCLQDATGHYYEDVYGLAYTSANRLWAVQAIVAPQILSIDDVTGRVEVSAITGGFTCGFGLACLPCGTVVDPCAQQQQPPADVGPALRVTDHGDPLAADITAVLSWPLDAGAPRPPGTHFHVKRSLDPRTLAIVADPVNATSYVDSTPTAFPGRLCHFYKVFAADSCERESAD